MPEPAWSATKKAKKLCKQRLLSDTWGEIWCTGSQVNILGRTFKYQSCLIFSVQRKRLFNGNACASVSIVMGKREIKGLPKSWGASNRLLTHDVSHGPMSSHFDHFEPHTYMICIYIHIQQIFSHWFSRDGTVRNCKKWRREWDKNSLGHGKNDGENCLSVHILVSAVHRMW